MNIFCEIDNLHASTDDTGILKGVDLAIGNGAIHALMGPNGSGKSTLAQVLAGHPGYEVTGGTAVLGGKNLLDMDPDERTHAGLFLAFQYPVAVPGVPVISLIRAAYNALRQAQGKPKDKLTVAQTRKLLEEEAQMLHIDKDFIDRPVNDGFSGGEKKKLEMLQMVVLKPKFIILDETDSGLDVDALQIVGDTVNRYKEENPDVAILIITHYQRILRYIKPGHVHVMKDGKIIKSGDAVLAEKLEKSGYQEIDG